MYMVRVLADLPEHWYCTSADVTDVVRKLRYRFVVPVTKYIL